MIFSLKDILLILIPILVSSITAFCFLRLPHEIVRLQGKFYRKAYKEVRKLSDQEIDDIYQLPTDRFFMGARSDFIRNAPDKPEKFTRLIRCYRAMGCFLTAIFLLIFAVLLLALTLGPVDIFR